MIEVPESDRVLWIDSVFGGAELPHHDRVDSPAMCVDKTLSIDGRLYVWIHADGKWADGAVQMAGADRPAESVNVELKADMARLMTTITVPVNKLLGMCFADGGQQNHWVKRCDGILELVEELRAKYGIQRT